MSGDPSYPTTRMRRVRQADWSRRLVSENQISVDDLIWPIFIREGENLSEAVPSMPGVDRLSVDKAVYAVAEAHELGIPAIALFPNTPDKAKSDDAKEALNPDNLVNRAVRAIKAAVPWALGR